MPCDPILSSLAHAGPRPASATLRSDPVLSLPAPVLGHRLRAARTTRTGRTTLRIAAAFLVVSLALAVVGGAALIAANRVDPGPLAALVARPPPPAPLGEPATNDGPREMLSPAALFDSQDVNADGRIDVSEAKTFYEWVRDNLTYRWDDEGRTLLEAQGYPVGDGRVGRDYTQTPLETLTEGFGDCEDLNGLQLAFYTHWKIPAYLAFVNAVSNSSYDHALTIVFGATTIEDFQALFGDAPFYEATDRPGIADGYYFLVDNAYSRVFAHISGGMRTDKFVIDHVASFGSLYGDDWKPGPTPIGNATVAT